jgi:hypothetical protein
MHKPFIMWFLAIKTNRKRYTTYVPGSVVFEINITVKWGNTSKQCVTCHYEKHVVTCTRDTQHTEVLSCDSMVTEHTHDVHCACPWASVSVNFTCTAARTGTRATLSWSASLKRWRVSTVGAACTWHGKRNNWDTRDCSRPRPERTAANEAP